LWLLLFTGEAHWIENPEDVPLPGGQAVELVRVRAHDVGQLQAASLGRHGER